jgi:catechol 2,3-dioxygenase-like lactoylglutathione lyase family enzyme
LNVTSVDAHKKFWVDTLGGTMTKIGKADVVRFPDIFLFLDVKKPIGPTYGTALDHIGFAVPDVPALTTKIVANGYQLTTGREPKPGEKVALPTAGNYGRFSYLLGPDGAKVELVTNMTLNAPPIVHHHVHFINKEYVEMQQWYMKALNATARTGPNTFTDFFAGADLPGVGYMLNFFRWEGDRTITHAPTAGRVYDHVGFEVKNLAEFCKQLEAKGIKLTRPYGKDPEMNNMPTAAMVDPWGVSIELTEGLRDVQN